MAKRKLDIFLGVDNAEVKSKLTESVNLFKNFQTTLSGILGGAALGVSIKSMGDFAVNASKKFEQAQISFSKMLQSEKDGQKLINDIQDLANTTPMTSDSLADNARLLLNFNAVAKDEVIPTLRMLGDITGGDKGRMDSLTLAFAQSASAGRLMGQDLLQMINAGFNPLQIMSEKTGKSMATLKDEMSKGKISTDMVVQAFKDATSAGGKFYGMMEAQSKSKAGLEATKADSIEILARTITDVAMPALKELDQAQIDFINRTTDSVKKLQEWAQVNNQTTNAIANAGLALVTAVAGFQSLRIIVETVSKAHLTAVAAVQAETEATAALTYAKKVLAAEEVGLYQATLANNAAQTAQTAKDLKQAQASYAAATAQVAKTTAMANSTKATVLQTAMTGNLTKALQLATAQARAFAISLLTTPLGWAALAVGGLTAAFFALKNSAESTHKAIEDLNNQQEKNVDTTTEAIGVLKELGNAKNLNYDETKRLENAENTLKENLGDLVKKYPNYIDKLKQELALKGQISQATAEQIANELTLAKVKQLIEKKQKIDKKVDDAVKGYKQSQLTAAARFGFPVDVTQDTGRRGASKRLQREQDEVNKELNNVKKEYQAIINSIKGVGANTNNNRPTYNTSTPTTSKKRSGTSDANKQRREEERQRREAIALRQAELDAEILQVQKNSEEEYKLELQKVNAKIALEKQGTAAYQQALNERTQLQQQHQQQVGEMELAAYNNQVTLDNLKIEHDKAVLDQEKERGGVSDEEYYNKLLDFEAQKYNLKLEGLNREAELYKNDLQKYNEIQQQKLVLTAEYENQKLNITNDSIQAEHEKWRNALNDIGNSFSESISGFISGNQTLKDSFLSIFNDIKSAFAKMIAEMLVEQAKLKMMKGLTAMAGGGGWLGTAASFIKGFFADGGIVPGQYSQPMPVIAHGSEMVLNPLQQKTLWNMIATGSGAGAIVPQGQNATKQQPVTINQITPVFQSLDPAQGQRMFNDWMKQSGISLVRDSIKNNNYQMRDVVKNASG